MIIAGNGQVFVGEFVRVVKESDSKSDGLCPRRFESCSSRTFFKSEHIHIRIYFHFSIFVNGNFHHNCSNVYSEFLKNYLDQNFKLSR